MADGIDRDKTPNGPRDLSARSIALIYLLFGTTALFLFDVVVPRVVTKHSTLHRIQTVKAGVEVGATAILVYVLVARSRRSLSLANDQLRETRTRLTVLYRVLRHNLRTEMTLLRGYVERGRERTSKSAARSACSEAVAITDEVSQRINKIHAFRDVVQHESTRMDISLADVIDRALDRVDSRIEHDAAISVEDLTGLEVKAVPEIEHAITEIIENAIVHNDTDGPTVNILAVRDGSFVTLDIRDNGPGVPDQEATVIADVRDETSLDHASGIGLWLADWAAVESGGEMTIEGRDPRGTIVRLSLSAAGG